MAIRTKLLNGNNITRDTDFSKFIQTVSEPWVIEGFTVTANSVAVGQARVPCERTNGETLYALIYNTAPVSISGNGEVYILVNQTYIDDGELANEDGTGIATIVVGTTPSKNALKLATITGGVVADERNIIPKVWELKTYIQSLNTRMNTAEQKIDEIIEETVVDHLEQAWVCWEKYTLSDNLFVQNAPTLNDSTLDVNIWDLASNTQIHIQRIASWTASNKLKIKAKKIWAPTTWLVVEVRRGVEVDVSDSEAYWYWGDLLCSGSIGYSSFTTDYQEFEVSLSWQFGGTKGELLDIVIYQTGNIVNSTNYYAIAYDSSQYWQAFRYIAVNWSTRTTSEYMPYCASAWFLDKLICKAKADTKTWYQEFIMGDWSFTGRHAEWNWTWLASTPTDWYIHIEWLFYDYNGWNAHSYWKRRIWDSEVEITGQFQNIHQRVPAWTRFQMWWMSTEYSWNDYRTPAPYKWARVRFASEFFAGGENELKWLPRGSVEIGQVVAFTTYWLDTNWFWTEQLTTYQTATSCSTWTISLGSCFWYIVLKDKSWKIFKVPYYEN